MNRIIELTGLACLMGFTIVTTLVACYSHGALVYFYEPNQYIMAAEIAMGLYGFFVGIFRIMEILESRARSTTRPD